LQLLAALALLAGGLTIAPAAQAATPSWPSCGSGASLIGYSDALDKTVYQGTDVGGLSGLAYDAARNVYYAVVDNQGSTPSRVYTLSIPVSNNGLGNPAITAVTILLDKSGTPFTGENFDGEGLTMAKNGDWLISSETEPSIREFSRDGRLVAELPVPSRFKIKPLGQATRNQAFEGVSLTPSGQTLFVTVESPLSADGYTLDFKGRNRILRYTSSGNSYAPVAQYYYQTDTLEAVSDILAISDTSLLVLERNFIPGYGNTIRVYQASLVNATDVTNIASLATGNISPLPKKLVVDLGACPDQGVPVKQPQPNRLLDNYEALAWAPATSGSQRTLLVMVDDNFSPVEITRVVALSITTRDVSGRR